MSVPEEVDIIICGGGGAGCPIAAGLANARPDLKILLLEQGQDNRDVPRLRRPLDSLFWLFSQNPYLTWHHCEAQDELGGRRPRIPVGRLLGGGTSINTLMYNTGAASDFEDWDQPGWSWQDMKPLIQETVNFNVPPYDNPSHSRDGPFEVSMGGHQMDWGDDFRRACQGAVKGIKSVDCLTTYTPEASHAVGRQPKMISSKGLRSNVADAYLHPCKATNLHVLTSVVVSKVILEDGRATAVEILQEGPEQAHSDQVKVIKARQMIIVTCGTLGSPCLLERSGIGDPEVLKKARVEVKVILPGVGAELNDHQLTCCSYHSSKEDAFDDYARGEETTKKLVDETWEKTGSGIAATNGFDYGYKLRPTNAEIEAFGFGFEQYWKPIGASKPDKPLYSCVIIPYFYSYNPRPSKGSYFCFGGFHNYPASRGSVHITSSDPFQPPVVNAGLLTNPVDLPVHVWHYKIQREIARRLPFYRGEEAGSHPKFSPSSNSRLRTTEETWKMPEEMTSYSEEDDKVIEDWVRGTVATAYHTISTCPMRAQKEGGVVDPRLNVHGVKGLKVADLSICPVNIGTNTTSTVLLIAAKAVKIFLEDLQGLGMEILEISH